MFKGIVLALSACFIWGLIFVIPQYMGSFSPIEIAIGRYTFFGILSLCLLLKARLKGACNYSLSVWTKAFLLSFLSGYYLWVVLGIRYASPEICALVLGISPVTIAFWGNWKEKEGNFKRLILPSILILIGLILINAPHIIMEESSKYIWGLVFSFISLISWSAYAVYNSRYLKRNPQIVSSDWATIQGVVTFSWVMIGCIAWSLFGGEPDLQKYLTWNHDTISFYVGCAVLGLLCSWVGAFLWNKATIHLPISLAGQLMIFETIFGVIFVYTINQQLPSLMEFSGIILLLSAVFYGIQALSSQPSLEVSES